MFIDREHTIFLLTALSEMPSISLNAEDEIEGNSVSINISCLTALFPTDSSARCSQEPDLWSRFDGFHFKSR